MESDEKLNEIVRLFLRTGYNKFAGYLVGGMKAWDNAGFPLDEVGQMTVHEIQRAGEKLQLLDVRAPDEWKGGHIPNARHIFLGELREHLGDLDKTKPTAVYCDSGYRASIATSILKQEGFGCVSNVPGSWQAWKKAGFPGRRGNREERGEMNSDEKYRHLSSGVCDEICEPCTQNSNASATVKKCVDAFHRCAESS